MMYVFKVRNSSPAQSGEVKSSCFDTVLEPAGFSSCTSAAATWAVSCAPTTCLVPAHGYHRGCELGQLQLVKHVFQQCQACVSATSIGAAMPAVQCRALSCKIAACKKHLVACSWCKPARPCSLSEHAAAACGVGAAAG